MSDRSHSHASGGADAPSIGAYLARQRQLRGISLEELEAETRIPRRSLARLEAGAFDGHSDAFARGFVRAVAAALGLDTEEALLRLLDAPRPAEEAARRAGLRARRLLLASLGAALLAGLVLGLRAANPAALGRTAGRLFLGGPVVVVPRPDAVRDLVAEAEQRAREAPPRPSAHAMHRAAAPRVAHPREEAEAPPAALVPEEAAGPPEAPGSAEASGAADASGAGEAASPAEASSPPDAAEPPESPEPLR